MRAGFISAVLIAAALGSHAATAETAPPKPVTAGVSPPPGNPGQSPAKAPTLKPGAAEAAYRARLRALLSPLLTPRPSAGEIQALKDALKSRQAGALGDPIARKLVQWQALKAGIGETDAFLRFASESPSWPDSQLLVRRAEEQIFTAGGGSATIRAYFKSREPANGAGWGALASAALAEGDTDNARALAQRAWTEHDLAASLEAGFLDRFGKLLGPADHKRRLDRLLVDRLRFSAERRERAAIARRVIKLLPESERSVAEMRLAVFLKDKAAGRKLTAMPITRDGKTDWGLAYAHAAAHLDAHRLTDAAQILTRLPADADLLVSPDDWWLLRREAIFQALKAGKPDLAYDLAKLISPLSANPAKEQAHMAGWIALRLLKKPAVALRHFEVHRKAADGPLSRARSNYWTGRALEALGSAAQAKARYAEAMQDPDTFHGLLARQKLAGTRATDLAIKMPAVPSTEQVQRVIGLDSVRAAVLAARAGLDHNIAVGLFAATRNFLDTEAELALLAELATALDDTQTALRVGKSGIARGHNLIIYAYPVDAYPQFQPLGRPPETALMLAIARQETEFNHTIVSSAGASGLLQVMAVTAKHVCREHKIPCDLPRLLTDNAYNAMISSAYIADRMREFGGWYVVTLAGYNAGPGRARQWMRENGDPRSAGADAMDWMERIPIEETRGYVEKVLSNLQIYRARLGEQKPLRLVNDLEMPTGRER